MGAKMDDKEPGFELKWLKMGQNGLFSLVRLRLELQGFKDCYLHLVSALGHDKLQTLLAGCFPWLGASCTQRKVSMVLFVLPSILLLVVIVVTVVIVVVISVVVVVAIVGVVVVVVVPLVPVFLSVFAMLAACASKAAATLSATSCRMASLVMAGAADVDVLLGGILST
ncbi:hypothetical protein Tco_1003124 [Tanacetum coccineum]|uniref:Uncharacterized protein n=1 Tax=Tanacetum coccineum TaxID=301880 RepID=A0ABQ5F8F9_9ASTR